MLRYTLRRILLAIPTFLGITVVTFAMTRLAPGDPVQDSFDDAGTASDTRESYERLREHFGLNDPVHTQYIKWVSRAVTLDFGNSFSLDRQPVWHKIRARLGWTVGVALLSILMSLAFAVPIGVYSAVRPGGWFDSIASTLLFALYSVPSYVMAMALILLVVAAGIDWLPIRNAYSDEYDELSLAGKTFDLFKHGLLITLCFTYPSLAFQSRFVRGNLLEVLQQDYVRTAKSKGLRAHRIVWKHAFRNTLVPLITYLGLVFPTIVAGSAILEVMFNWPGIGRLMYDSILQRDYPTVMALSVVSAALVLAGTLIADLAYAFADPRIRYDRGHEHAAE